MWDVRRFSGDIIGRITAGGTRDELLELVSLDYQVFLQPPEIMTVKCKENHFVDYVKSGPYDLMAYNVPFGALKNLIIEFQKPQFIKKI